ncbi:hypothetical protein JCM10213_005734 [Rhodosporidiobolus nylandii]
MLKVKREIPKDEIRHKDSRVSLHDAAAALSGRWTFRWQASERGFGGRYTLTWREAHEPKVDVRVRFACQDVTLSIEVSNNASEPVSSDVDLSRATAEFAACTSKQAPSDVLLLFPRCERQIWTTSSLLSTSPYFETLLASSFAENTPAKPVYKPRATTSAEAITEDSDDKGDSRLPSMPLPDFPPPPFSSTPFKTITIDESCYTTYLAVLCFMQLGRITFAPLLSSFRPASNEPPATSHADQRFEALSKVVADAPSLLPLPVSPKSVYRLADILDLPNLQQLALANRRSQLTPEVAAVELFSNAASCYAEVRDLVLDYVIEKKEEVFQSEPMKRMMARGEAGELPEPAMRTWVALLKRVGGV